MNFIILGLFTLFNFNHVLSEVEHHDLSVLIPAKIYTQKGVHNQNRNAPFRKKSRKSIYGSLPKLSIGYIEFSRRFWAFKSISQKKKVKRPVVTLSKWKCLFMFHNNINTDRSLWAERRPYGLSLFCFDNQRNIWLTRSFISCSWGQFLLQLAPFPEPLPLSAEPNHARHHIDILAFSFFVTYYIVFVLELNMRLGPNNVIVNYKNEFTLAFELN